MLVESHVVPLAAQGLINRLHGVGFGQMVGDQVVEDVAH